MTETINALSGYYREIRSWLPCSRKQKDQILERFRDSVQSYWEENPTADFAQIRAHFGTPEQIAGAYVEELGTAELLRSLRVRRRILITVTSIAMAVLLIWMAAVGWAMKQLNDNSKGQIIDEIGQITSTEGAN